MLFFRIDQHARQLTISLRDPQGNFLLVRQVSTRPDKILQFLDHFAIDQHLMDACFVGDEQVQSQAGRFYGGWITSKIVGPIKGEPGTHRW
ncbi:hypothetical protein Pan54_14220 [Rubinisphaera italica]|uniref:Uncharacterized protein n=1 Tax=Rubinisphaera italica TaxID=2527969 RepID=A0A5C5XEX2_9PLAN|nr:hypothetical protein [Rubinisphaera italica]TWT60695.1 hypothetical protein Pan54_14220 [Rubinisphaera italica]